MSGPAAAGREPVVVVHADAGVLARAVAARLLVRLMDAQARRGRAAVVLTGGRVAAEVYRAVRDSPARDAVDWRAVELWWGDERYLPAGSLDRNDTQAREALLDALPLDPARVHPMPAPDGASDPEVAAAGYARVLAGAAGAGVAGAGSGGGTARDDLPYFDVVLLGVGEDGHVASVFPGHPVAGAAGTVAAVHDAPKPPPVRLTLTLPALDTAEQVWLIASGDGKADAVGRALGGEALPAASVHGVQATLWLLDRAAAAKVPQRRD